MQARIVRPSFDRPYLTVVLLVLTVATLLIMIHHTAEAFQADLLKTLKSRDLALVEVGSYWKMRVLHFLNPWFETRKSPRDLLLVGVSATGDRFILSAQSPYVGREDREVTVTTIDDQIVRSIQPIAQEMTVFSGELSPDGHLIAFVGSFTNIPNVATTYGLHLLDVSGDVRTLVATGREQLPTSIGWSSDGKSIVYDSSHHVFLYHLETNTSSFFADGSHPTWSPDGQWIAYQRLDGTAALVSPDRAHSKSVLDKVRIAAGLRWSPDSNYSLFTGAGGIKVLDIANGGIATVFVPVDQYNESRLRWVRGLPN